MNAAPGHNVRRYRLPLVLLSGVIVLLCALASVRGGFARALFLPLFFLNVIVQVLLLKLFAAQEYAEAAAARALADAAARLDALETRNRQLENAIGKLEEVERLKKNFLLTASHQMRSPLVAIQSVIRAVVSGAISGDPDGSRNLLQQAYNRSEDMLVMVNDILNLAEAKVEQDTGDEHTDPAAELASVVTFLSPQASEREITIETDVAAGLPPVRVVRKSLNHVFTNLIENAVKYSPDKTAVRVRLAPDGGRFLFEVADSGIGIPESEQPKIFKEFFRADNARTLRNQGTGLGLAIVQNIVINLGGDIGFVSKEGQGTTFTVHIPFEPVPAADAEKKA